MNTGLAGRTVMITGAARNIGRETALAFAREGANLALCTRQSTERLTETAAQIRELGAQVLTAQCDVSQDESVKAFVAATLEEFGRVDVAINNAVRRNEGSLLEQSLGDWEQNIAVNLTGPFLISRAVVPSMIEHGFGRIINFSGIAPYLGIGPAKSMAKLGIVGFTRGLATEVAEHAITANCIGPGQIDVEREHGSMTNPCARTSPFAGSANLRISPAWPFTSPARTPGSSQDSVIWPMVACITSSRHCPAFCIRSARDLRVLMQSAH